MLQPSIAPGTKLIHVLSGNDCLILEIGKKMAKLEMTGANNKTVIYPISIKDIQNLISLGHYKIA